MSKFRLDNMVKSVIIGEIILVLYLFLSFILGMFENQKLASMDILNKMVYKLKPAPHGYDDIVIVSIDEDSIRELGLKFPWSRKLYADFVDAIARYQPNLIFLDLSFVGKSMQSREQDSILANAFREAGNVLIPSFYTNDGYALLPEEEFQKTVWGYGPANKVKGIDNKVRSAWVKYYTYEDEVVDYCVELRIISKYLGSHNLLLGEGEWQMPAEPDGTMTINYTRRFTDFVTVPFWKVMKGAVEPGVFKDKIVMLGITTPGLRDVYMTPIGPMPNVGIIANTALMFLNDNFFKKIHNLIPAIWLSLLIILFSMAVYKLSILKSIFAGISLLFIDVLLKFILFWNNYPTEIFSPFFLCIVVFVVINFYKYVCLIKEKNSQLEAAFCELKKAQTELIQSEKLAAMGRLTAQLSHEINNPLYAIQSGVQIARDIAQKDIGHAELEKIMERVLEEIRRLSRLTQQILCRYKYCKREITDLDINKSIDDVLSLCSRQLGEKNIKVFTNLDRKLPYIVGSNDQLKQVFLNIILNSYKAMPNGGSLRINSRLGNNGNGNKPFIQVDITDTGCGIAVEKMGRIFDPFPNNKDKTNETGLGLYTSYTIIKEHGGEIDIQSEMGKGTTFIIKIPLNGNNEKIGEEK